MATPTPVVLDPAFLAEIIYPDSDGKPMADNTKQFDKITTIKPNLDVVFVDRPDVFVAGDLLWYPVEGRPDIRVAPDVMVVFGRPKGDRGSYRQWREENIAPQVVFEILSPGNTAAEMRFKHAFYELYGVEEYYIYDPDAEELEGWRREGGRLVEIRQMDGWISPRLQVRFEIDPEGLVLYRPDGTRFLSFVELEERAARAEEQVEEAEERATEAEEQATEAKGRAKEAEERAQEAEERARRAEARSARLAARLRALGIDPDVNGLAK